MRVRKNPWKHLKKNPEQMHKFAAIETELGAIFTSPDYSTAPAPVATKYEYDRRKYQVLADAAPHSKTATVYVSLQDVRTFAEWRARQVGQLRAEVKRLKRRDLFDSVLARVEGDYMRSIKAMSANLLKALLKRNTAYDELYARYVADFKNRQDDAGG